MKLKKISLLILTILIFIVSGCSLSDENQIANSESGSTNKQTIVKDSFDSSGSGDLRCRQEVNAQEGLEVEINYFVNYKRGNILELRSISRVKSDDSSQLDQYENAYKSIAERYKNLVEYKTSVIRDSNTVTYDTTINYDKIDIDELLDIEGKEDNIIEGKKAKLSLWLKLAESVGVVCEEV